MLYHKRSSSSLYNLYKISGAFFPFHFILSFILLLVFILNVYKYRPGKFFFFFNKLFFTGLALTKMGRQQFGSARGNTRKFLSAVTL